MNTDRLIQIIRNSYIRLEGLVYQLFGFFRKFFGLLNQGFSFLSQLFGFTNSRYFLEENSAQDTKQAKASPDMPASASQSSTPATSATRRSPDANMDYFLKMAQQKKTSS